MAANAKPNPSSPASRYTNSFLRDCDEPKSPCILRKSLDEARRGNGREARQVLHEIAAKYGIKLDQQNTAYDSLRRPARDGAGAHS